MKKILPFIILFLTLFAVNCNIGSNKTHIVTFYNGEEIYVVVSVNDNEVVNEPLAPEKDGFDFLYWQLDGEEYDFSSPVNKDLDLYCEFGEIFTITYYVDGREYKVETAHEGELLEEPTSPIKLGFEFSHWECEGQVYDFNTPVSGDLELKCVWGMFVGEIIDVILMNGDKMVDIISVDKGNDLSLLNYIFVKKDCYQFAGWYYEDTLITPSYIPSENMTLYARWEPLGTIYEITLDGVVKEMLENDEYNLPTKTQRDYIHVGWVDENMYFVDSPLKIDGNYTLTSVWREKGVELEMYTLKLEGYKEIDVFYSDKYRLPTCSQLGYEFKGWTDGTYFYNSGYELKVVGDITLTPVYEQLNRGEDYSNVAYTINNLDIVYEGINFPLTTDIDLPEYDSTTGATIIWESSNENVITNDGRINRIMTSEHVLEAMMTATVTCNGETEIKEYCYTIKRELKDISKGVVAGYLTPGSGLNDLALQTLDIVYGAFIYFSEDGRITSEKTFMDGINIILGKAHENGIRIIVSVGAQSSGSGGPIVTIAKDATLRQRFANSLLDFVVRNNLDGVDMDWETPSSSNAKYYTELMRTIYNTFKSYDEELLITSAIGAGPWQYKNYDLTNSSKYHDYINMMSYDMQLNSKSTFHNALYSSSNGYTMNSSCSIDATVKLYNNVGIPNEKIIIGIPFYGKYFINSNGVGKSGTYTSAKNQTNIRMLLYKNGEYVSGIEFWDDECKVPYIYDSEAKIFISYDNPRSIAEKVKYAGENGIAGVMYWRHDQDSNNLLMTALNENLSYLKNR